MSDPIFQSIVLGILQGLTEFLPISSSAHLLVLPWLMNWEPMGVTFDVMLHAGTLLAVIVYFRRELQDLAFEGIHVLKRRELSPDSRLLPALVLGTIPAILIGGSLHGFIESELRIPIVTCVTLSVFGVLLWWAGRVGKQNRRWADIGIKYALIIGVAQAVALVPGVSRSGITITAALLLGFSRMDSARFSFLLAVPVISLTTLVKFYELATSVSPISEGFTPLAVGVLCSFVSGFLCIKYFLRFLEKRSFLAFACYRLLLAAVILWLLVL